MVLTVDGCTRLVAWTAFVWFELYRLGERRRRQYEKEMAELHMPAFQLPSWVFQWVWFVLKALIVTSMFFWMEYATDVNDYSFPWTFALTFALVVLSKLWSPLFWEYSMFMASFILACVLAALSIAIMVLMVLSTNEGDLWAVPFGLWVPVMAWYCFAALLSFEWFRLKAAWWMRHHHHKHHNHHGDEEQNGGSYKAVVTDPRLATAQSKPVKHALGHKQAIHHIPESHNPEPTTSSYDV